MISRLMKPRYYDSRRAPMKHVLAEKKLNLCQNPQEADDVTRQMTREEYQHYSDCRQASFTYRKGWFNTAQSPLLSQEAPPFLITHDGISQLNDFVSS